MELLVIAILFTLTGAQESQLKGPENTLSVVGSNAKLKCLSPYSNCTATEWLKYSAGNPMTIFNHHGIISSGFRDRFRVEHKSGCDLIIENVELTDAGLFICRAFISPDTSETFAYLIILETQPKCMINAFLLNTLEGDRVQLTCEVTYNGINRASMVWKGVENAPAAVAKNMTISRSYSVVASANGVPSFTCATSFAVETDFDGEPIRDSVRNVTLSPSLFNYSPGSVITCTAKGNPSPIFKWQELENDGAWMDIQNQNGSQFSVSDSSFRRYRCSAVNVLNGRTYSATSGMFQFYNREFEDKLSLTATSASNDRLAIGTTGGIGIGLGIGLLVAILLASIAFAIMVRFGYLEFHPRPAIKPVDGGTQHMDHEMNPSSHQLSAKHPSIPRTETPLVGEQESTYASLGGDRDANEYAALELRQKAKPKK